MSKRKTTRTKRLLGLMKKYGVSFDLDGVKAATAEDAVKLYNNKYGLKYKSIKSVNDLKHFYAMTDWFNNIKKKHGDFAVDPMEASISIWNDRHLLRTAPVAEGIYALLRFLINNKINPYYITSRPFKYKKDTVIWLRGKFSKFGNLEENLHVQSGSDINPDFKADKASDLGVLFHFDDSGEHAEKIADKNIIVGLVVRPWSKDYEPKSRFVVKPTKYQGRSEIIRTFLSLSDYVYENPTLINKAIESHNYK